MARLSPDEPREIALLGRTADFKVEPNESHPVEIWERFVDFDAAPPLPRFRRNQVFAFSESVSRNVPVGSVYQARLYREDEGDSSGNSGRILGKVDFPCLDPKVREGFLTNCADRPQLKIAPGGTFVAMTGATSAPTRVRVQLAAGKPRLDAAGFPFFRPDKVVAAAVSNEPDFVYRLTPIDELLLPDTEQHTQMEGGQDLFYIVLAWDEFGRWDYAWTRAGISSPSQLPEMITTKRRAVDVRLARLLCHDDSDDVSDGEAEFKFIVRGAGAATTKVVRWQAMASGEELRVPTGTADVHLGGTDAAGIVSVRVDGVEDDSGSFPPDDDDPATTHQAQLGFPVGEGREQVAGGKLVLTGRPTVTDGEFRFSAEITYDVQYD